MTTTTLQSVARDRGDNWRSLGSCSGRADEFDVDIVGRRQAATRSAVAACRACPVFAECRTATRKQVADGTPPKQVVQAGAVWTKAGKVRKTKGVAA